MTRTTTSKRKPAAPRVSVPTVPAAPIASAPSGAVSKKDAIIALLSRPEGASISAMMETTGWQQHSVRGFLAGIVKKKLGNTLTSRQEAEIRVYRIEPAGTLA